MSALDQYKTLNVMVGIPHNGVWHAEFGMSLCNMVGACYKYRIGEYKDQIIHTMCTQGSILPKSRHLIVKDAVEKKMDYLLFIDSDQTFPRKTLHLLISRGKDVIGANVATKQIPAQPTARSKKEGDPPYGMLVYTDRDSVGIEQVWRLGCGILLLSRKALLALSQECFSSFYREDVGTYQGEDWTMCDNLEQQGIPIFVDHDLSKEVGHVGYFTYTHEVVGELMTKEQKEKYDAEQGKGKEDSGLVLRPDLRGIQAPTLPGPAGSGRGEDQGSLYRGEGSIPNFRENSLSRATREAGGRK